MSKKLTLEEFIDRSNIIHNFKYDYEESEYINSKEKIKIKCPKHGLFLMSPNNHLRGHGCPKCKTEKISKLKHYSKETFVEKAKKVHGDKYDYSDINYIDSLTKICIFCKKCGNTFLQTPSEHLQGHGCHVCGGTKKLAKETFIERAINVHGNLYCYDDVIYKNSMTKVAIKCNVCNNTFLQIPRYHLQGKGCFYCKMSHLEREIMNFLNNTHINYVPQKHFKWLGKQTLDFYLPDYNIAIECQGEQHFKPVKHFGGEERNKQTINNDIKKYNICEKNNIKVIYFFPKEFKDYLTENNKLIYRDIFHNTEDLHNYLTNELWVKN